MQLDLATLMQLLQSNNGPPQGMAPGVPGASGQPGPMPGFGGGMGGGWQDILQTILGGAGPGGATIDPGFGGPHPYGDDMILQPLPYQMPPGGQQGPGGPQGRPAPPGGGGPNPIRSGPQQAPRRGPLGADISMHKPPKPPGGGGGGQSSDPRFGASGKPAYNAWSRQTGNQQNLSFDDWMKPSQANWFKDQWNNRRQKGRFST